MKFYRENFITIRETMRMSQNELAEKLGVTQQAVQQWENGTTKPRPAKVYAAAKALGVSAVDISDLKPESWLSRDVEPFTGAVKDFPVISEAAAAQCNTAFVPIADWASEVAEERVSFSEGRPGDFVLRVSGTSMMPWYPPNTLILARPHERPKNGDRVIAVLADGSVVFKVFAEKGEFFYLLSVNEADGADFKFAKTDFGAVRDIYLVIQSMRDERALDRAMTEKGIAHFWQNKLNKL